MELSPDAWERIASDSALTALMIKDRSEEVLTAAEEMQLNAYWMGYFIRREWEGGSGGSVSAGKDNFSPEFVAYIEKELASER